MKWNIICLMATIGLSAALPQSAPPPPKTGKSLKDAKTLEEVAPVIKAAARIDVESKIRLGSKRQLVRFGPLEMPGAKVSPGINAPEIYMLTAAIAQDGRNVRACPWQSN
jgi:hypothetical protein